MTRSRSIAVVAVAAGLSLVVVGCGAGKETTIGAASPPTLPAPQSVYEDPSQTIDLGLLSINHMVNSSDAAVIATVNAVSAPKWNSDNGSVWISDPNNPDPQKAQPFQYRGVTLQINQVLFASSGLNPAVGSTIDVKVYGSGANTGAMIGGDPNDRWNQIAGPFTAGDTQLLFLTNVDFPMQSGPTPSVVLNHDLYGHWIVVGSTAQSTVTGRTVPLQDLKNRIAAERAAGLQQETPDQASKTETNPLG